MKKLPTDLELLNPIYENYYQKFTDYVEGDGGRDSKIYVPIDLKEIGKWVGVDSDIVFGRLYYDLNKRYGYVAEDQSEVPFFALAVGKDNHCINFPLLASVLAELRRKNKNFVLTTAIAVLALVTSFVSIAISILKHQ
jgi:hypothetical protein